MYYRIFDCWRFAAVMLIMIYHYSYFAPREDVETLLAFSQRFLSLLDMFFMLSGFLIMTRCADQIDGARGYLRYLRRRFARLYPLHFFTLLAFVAIGAAGAGGLITLHHPTRWNFGDLPFHILGLHAWGTTETLGFNYPSWSVSAEFFCYILFPVIVFAARRAGVTGMAVLLLAWLVLLETMSRAGVFLGGHWSTADTFGAYRAFADFTAGAIAAKLVARRVLPIRSHVPGLLALLCAVTSMAMAAPVYLTLVLLFLAVLLIGLSETARPASTARLAPLMPLTRVSFGVYILHSLPEIVFLSFLWQRIVAPTQFVSFYLFWLIPMGLTLVMALLSFRLVEGPLGRRIAGPRREGGSAEGERAKPTSVYASPLDRGLPHPATGRPASSNATGGEPGGTI